MSVAVSNQRAHAWLFEEFPALAPAWLTRQRWFGGKTRTIDQVTTVDVVWLSAAPLCALLIMDVRYGGDEPGRDRYAALVGVTTDADAATTIGSLGGDDQRLMAERSTDPFCIHALAKRLIAATPLRGIDSELRGHEASDGLRHALFLMSDAEPRIAPIGAEQSNTSLRLGLAHVFKLLRRLDEGESPQVEIGRVLRDSGFTATPCFEGSLTYRVSDEQMTTVGVVESWLENKGDGWRYVLDQLQRSAVDEGAEGELLQETHILGSTTAAFHAAMASRDDLIAFAPAAVISDDVEAWRHALHHQGTTTFELVARRHHQWTGETAVAAQEFLSRRAAFEQRLDAVSGWRAHGFDTIRVHGDYHLGQTLKLASGFAIIDFEGEPSKPLALRRQKHCALKDVAGMIRSFDYAVRSLGTVPSPDAMVRALSAAFLDGYRSRAQGSRFVPAEDERLADWVSFFELEKALYEVEYEANSRPTWAHIPLRGVNRLLGSSA